MYWYCEQDGGECYLSSKIDCRYEQALVRWVLPFAVRRISWATYVLQIVYTAAAEKTNIEKKHGGKNVPV